jgi:hypothetical protein
LLAETISFGSTTGAVTQLIAETLSFGTVTVRVTQVLAEVISRAPGPVPPAPPSNKRKIRRMRQTPHVSDEQTWLYVSSFQLDLETGFRGNRGGR